MPMACKKHSFIILCVTLYTGEVSVDILYESASERQIFQSFGVPGGAGAQKMASLIPWIASMVLLGRDLSLVEPKNQKMSEDDFFPLFDQMKLVNSGGTPR